MAAPLRPASTDVDNDLVVPPGVRDGIAGVIAALDRLERKPSYLRYQPFGPMTDRWPAT